MTTNTTNPWGWIVLHVGLMMVVGCASGGGGGAGGGDGGGAGDGGLPTGGDAAVGRVIHQDRCASCHGDVGLNNPSMLAAVDLAGEEAEFVALALADEEHEGGTFPDLTVADYDDLAAFYTEGGGEGEGESEGEGEGEAEGELLREFTLPLPLFAPDSAWNQRADEATVLPESDDQMLVLYRVLLGDNTSLHPQGLNLTWPFIDMAYDEFSTAVFQAGAGALEVLVRDYEGTLWYPNPRWSLEELGGPVTVPAPAGSVRPSGPQDTGADGLLVLYDPTTSMVYDFWQPTTLLDGTGNSLGGGQTGSTILEAGEVTFFDLRGSGASPPTVYSASASGVPLLAGMLLPEDVEGGAIEHAFAFSIPRPRNLSPNPFEPLVSDYFYPTSTTETDFYSTDPLALGSGQRIRLKPTVVDEEGNLVDENALAPITRMFLEAMRSYGAYLVDNGDGFSFMAEDVHTANLRLSDDEVNELIGQPPGSTLPSDKTKWQVVMEKLNDELERIPFASGPWSDYEPGGLDPATATYGIANYEVVDNATVPAE